MDSLTWQFHPGLPFPTKPAPYTPEPYAYSSTSFTNANTKAGTSSGLALPPLDSFQLSIIGRFTDGFHFYPVIIRDSLVNISPHHNLLGYGKSYFVEIDLGVLTVKDGSFGGYSGKKGW
ncbi:MAG: hypothetical protein R3B47_16250 [Bacteroidia bacterium]